MKKRDGEDEAENKDENDSFEWSSRSEHIMFFLLYLMDYGGLGSYTYDKIYEADSGFPFLQFLICAMIFSHPLLFFQTFIGQYTRKGCLFLGEMLPLTYGLGYSMVIVAFFTFSAQVFHTSMLLYYLLVSLCNSSPPWMKCLPSFLRLHPDCFSKRDIDLCRSKDETNEPCFKPGTRTLSASVFKDLTIAKMDPRFTRSLVTVILDFTFISRLAFMRVTLNEHESKWSYTSGPIRFILRTVRCILIFVPLVVITSKGMKNIYTYLRIVVSFSLVALLVVLVVIITRPGAFYGVVIMFDEAFSHDTLFSYRSWMDSFKAVTEMLRLIEGGNILFGSFIPSSDPDPRRSIYLTVAFIILFMASSLYFYLFLGILFYKLNISLSFLKESEENVLFETAPTFLGIQATAYFFCVIFYLVLSFISFYSLLIKLVVLEKTLAVHFNIRGYYFYVRIGICVLSFCLTCFISHISLKNKYREIAKVFRLYMLFAVGFQFVIMLLYGIQRFGDDIEYLTKVKVSLFMRFCWVAVPVIVSAIIYIDVMDDVYPLSKEMVFFISIISAPFLLCLIYKTFFMAKQRNMIGILRPTDDFGPPDIEERILRILYNPRNEVRYKRRHEVCYHKCLLNCEATKIAVNEEVDLIQNLINELKDSKADKALVERIISQVDAHRKNLLRAQAMRKKENE